jgi:hypothetical protein
MAVVDFKCAATATIQAALLRAASSAARTVAGVGRYGLRPVEN